MEFRLHWFPYGKLKVVIFLLRKLLNKGNPQESGENSKTEIFNYFETFFYRKIGKELHWKKKMTIRKIYAPPPPPL